MFFSLFKGILSLVTAVSLMFTGAVNMIKSVDELTFRIDASSLGAAIGNKVSNMNIWSAGLSDSATLGSNLADCSEFVEYVQIMQATGGNEYRDLFVDPNDFSVLDDYDFTKLINTCRTILNMGAKPLIKTGNVPMKYSQSKVKATGDFSVNVYPPDDYDVYYDYLYACFSALADVFGSDEMLTWRYGVYTEYENASWFYDVDDSGNPDPGRSLTAFCKLYDYTVASIQAAVGEKIFIGAHSMSVSEGLWDERDFIEHVANGTNYKTGEKGARICYLSSSFYDSRPGKYTSGPDLPGTIAILRDKAKSVGLNNLIYGVDEGRILAGNRSGSAAADLNLRICGYTYQAAYDARLIKQMMDNGIDYFSSWGYTSNGLSGGYPTVSFHVAQQFGRMAGMRRAKVARTGIVPQSWQLIKGGLKAKRDISAVAGLSADGGTLRIMAYNFKNDLDYSTDRQAHFSIYAPTFGDENVTVTAYVVDDDANYFDEWMADREKYGITDADATWSPDDPAIDTWTTLSTPAVRRIYEDELRDKYIECSKLVPVSFPAKFEDGNLTIDTVLGANTVAFYEISR